MATTAKTKTDNPEDAEEIGTAPTVGIADSYAVCFRGRHLRMIRAERARLEASLLGREVTDADAARSLIERAGAMGTTGDTKPAPREVSERAWTAEEIARAVYERAVSEAEEHARPFLCTSIEVRAALKIPESIPGRTITNALQNLAKHCPDAKVSEVGHRRHPCGTYVLWMIQAKPRSSARQVKIADSKPIAPKAEGKTLDATCASRGDEWSEERIAGAVHGLALESPQTLIVSVATVMEALKIPPSVSRSVISSAIERVGIHRPGARSVLIAGRRAGVGRGNIDMWSVSPSRLTDAPKQLPLCG